MSNKCKALKIMSFAVLIMAVVLIVSDITPFMTAESGMEYVGCAFVLACAVFNLYVGWHGILAANRPSNAEGLSGVAVSLAAVSVCAVAVLVQSGGFGVFAGLNAVVAAAFAIVAALVKKEAER